MKMAILLLGGWNVNDEQLQELIRLRPAFSERRISGQMRATDITTKMVPMPPPTTDNTGPNTAAVRPDSKAPISFEVAMKILLTEDTLPRISFGA